MQNLDGLKKRERKMPSQIDSNLTIDEITEKLISYSIDRYQMTTLLERIPPETQINRNVLEYEIQLLRILAVGWSIGYYTEDDLLKKALSESFWNSVRDFSNKLSSISSISMNLNFDYFVIIKLRLETYLNELGQQQDANDPTAVIGAKFAELCGHANDAIIIWLGGKMFQSVLSDIKGYLSGVKFVKDNHPFIIQSDTQ